MENEIYLGDGDVVHIHPNLNFAEVPTSKVRDIKQALAKALQNKSSWASGGVKCEILQQGGEWTSGTVRLEIVFKPDISDDSDAVTPKATQAIFVQYGNQ